jgi:uncharacterized protein (TIGR03437 family)
MSHPRAAALILFSLAARFGVADPPGAMVSQQVGGQWVSLPPGFVMSVWAQIVGARFLAIAPNGDVFVSQPGAGQISVLRPGPGWTSPSAFVYATGLNGPQGLAFATVDGLMWLYVGEETQIDRYPYRPGDTSASEQQVLVSSLMGDDAHPLKDIAIGPDNTVYFGYGSSANVNPEDVTANPELAAVYSMGPDGSNLQLVAAGLRNPEGLAVLPGTNMIWAAVNGRDNIPYPFDDSTGQYGNVITSYVDNHPPDLFTNLVAGANYGWPFCNSNPDTAAGYNGPPFDPDYDTNADGAVDCATMTRPTKGLQAHSAPLGFAFLQGTGFAPPYANGVLMAYHGSWNRSVPTGYRVVYFPWDSQYQTPGDPIDFITGFYGWGRPVDVAPNADGSLLITDDQAGVVYRLTWSPSAVSAANGYPVVAPGSYAAVYGANLPLQTESAAAPYPMMLGGGTLSITDAGGATKSAALVFVSPSQINFIVPDGLASGTAQLTLNTGNTAVNLGTPQIAGVTPGLFSLSGNGNGTAAALAVDDQQQAVPVFSCNATECSATPINVTGGTVYLSLYGTGIRGANGQVDVRLNGVSVPITFAGAQGTDPGLDQVNLPLPASMAGAGQVEVQVAAGGVTSNVVTIRIQ